MNYKKLVIFLLLFCLFSLSFVSASFSLGNSSSEISSVYAQNSSLRGWLNISFDKFSIKSNFSDNRGNSVLLKNLLNSSWNNNFEYECDVLDCSSNYESLDETTTKTITLSEGEEFLFGFKFIGNIESINSVNFELESNAPSSCSNQFELDFLDDEVRDYFNYKFLETSCEDKALGCYNESLEGTEITMSSTPFCQRITLTESPNIETGLWIKSVEKGDKEIKMSLFNLSGQLVRSCYLNVSEINNLGKEVSCLMNYSIIEEKDYYICASSEGYTGIFRAKGQSSGESCGFYGLPLKNETANYYIFGKSKKYDSPGIIKVSDYLASGHYASFIMENYIMNKYGSLNCQEGCYVPIKLLSKTSQTFTLKNSKINYDVTNYPGIESYNFQLLNEIPSRISSDFQKLYLNNQFGLPNEVGPLNYILSLEGENLYEQELEIKNATIIVTPLKVPVSFPITFNAKFLSDENASKYYWKFGEEIPSQTFKPEKIHTFSNQGNSSLELTIETSNGTLFSKEFLVEVSSPEESIEKIIRDLRANYEELQAQLAKISYFSSEVIKEDLGWNNLSFRINSLETRYETSKITEEYSPLINELLNINLPDSILQSSENKRTYFPENQDINVEVVGGISSGNVSFEGNYEGYEEAILYINLENINSRISSESFSYEWSSQAEPVIKTFEVEFNEKKSLSGPVYFFIRNSGNMKFDREMSSSGNYFYTKINPGDRIRFSSSPEVKTEDISMFLSPELSYLKVPGKNVQENKPIWWILILSLSILIILGLIGYVLWSRWYDKKYERALFPNRNNLYNLIVYINAQKAKGVSEADIRTNLQKAKWSSEQIRYVIRHYLGKNTGMWKPGANKGVVASKQPVVQSKTSQEKVVKEKAKLEHKGQLNISGLKIKPRSIFWLIFLGIITFGIYWFAWLIISSRELRKYDKRAPKTWFIFLPLIIYFIGGILVYLVSFSRGGTIIPSLMIITLIGITFILEIIIFWKYSTAHNAITKFSKIGLFLLLLLVAPAGIIVSQVKLNEIAKSGQKT